MGDIKITVSNRVNWSGTANNMTATSPQSARRRQPITAKQLSNHWLLEKRHREPIREQNKVKPIGEQDDKR